MVNSIRFFRYTNPPFQSLERSSSADQCRKTHGYAPNTLTVQCAAIHRQMAKPGILLPVDFLIGLSELHPAAVSEAVSNTWASGSLCMQALLLPSAVRSFNNQNELNFTCLRK